jgi:outer membrane protein assembly factor BamB
MPNFLHGLFLIAGMQCLSAFSRNDSIACGPDSVFSLPDHEVIIPTFLGNELRNYYGNVPPDTLEVLWKHYLGKGITVISRKLGSREWAGAGWTGQPLLIKEDTNLFIIQGAYDHHLKKINAQTGELVWQYKFDDVVKGTGSIWKAPDSFPAENRLIILQGSRLGVGNYLDTKYIPSYRAISYYTGKELWRLDIKWTSSYSRDVDASALLIGDTAYIGLENSLFTVLDPSPYKARIINGMLQPEIIQELPLYTDEDAIAHKNNVVTESSPCLLNGIIYVASGSGHVHGYNLKEKALVWDFYIGSDIDGSAVVTSDSCLLVSVEKQYIDGHGGLFKLDPSKSPDEAVVWYFPTGDRDFSGWEGGIIGSPSVNDLYNDGSCAQLAAFSAIDGYLYVIKHNEIDSTMKVAGPRNEAKYWKPKLVFRYKTGGSISTPIIVANKIIAAGYGGIYLFEYDHDLNFRKIAHFSTTFESTPVVHDGKVFIASRDGYFYCLGRK